MWSISDQPLISVILTVYNRAAFVQEAIESLLNQSYTNLEILAVVDGGSTDASPDIVRALAARDARLRPLFTEHLNQWQARNRALDAARGELIAPMDDDDIALPNRLATVLEWMHAHDLDVCGGLTKWFGSSDMIFWFPESPAAIRLELLFRIALMSPTVLMRTDLARAYRLNELLETYADYQQYTRLALHYRMGNVPVIVLRERAHADQLHQRQEAAMRRDSALIRKEYFGSLFPHAREAQRTLFHQIVHHVPFESAAALEAAGEWYAELAQVPEPFFQQRMALRWRELCRLSAPLGTASYRVYQRVLPNIQADADPEDDRLRQACDLRLPAIPKVPVSRDDAPRTTQYA